MLFFLLLQCSDIDKTTSEYAKERAKSEDKQRNELKKEVENFKDEFKKQMSDKAGETLEVTKEKKEKLEDFITIDDFKELKKEFKELKSDFDELNNRKINIEDTKKQ